MKKRSRIAHFYKKRSIKHILCFPFQDFLNSSQPGSNISKENIWFNFLSSVAAEAEVGAGPNRDPLQIEFLAKIGKKLFPSVSQNGPLLEDANFSFDQTVASFWDISQSKKVFLIHRYVCLCSLTFKTLRAFKAEWEKNKKFISSIRINWSRSYL